MFAGLTAFSSLTPSCPTFVIPVFAVVGRNESYVQDLSPAGSVRGFRRFEPAHFYSVPVHAVAQRVEVGSDGIIAFWYSAAGLIVGTIAEVRERLRQIDTSIFPAFTAVEVETLIGDAHRLSRAADRAAAQIPAKGASADYKVMIISRSNLITRLTAEVEGEPENEADQSLSAMIKILRHEQDAPVWARRWCETWSEVGGSVELLDLLDWKISTGYDRWQQAVCVSAIARGPSAKYDQYALSWLRKNFGARQHWLSIWSALSARDNEHHGLELSDALADYLEEAVAPSGFSDLVVDHIWSSYWSRLWQQGYNHTRLLHIALLASETNIFRAEAFVESVLYNIMDRYSAPSWILGFLEKWLRRPRQSIAWIKAYVRFSETFDSSSEYLAVGVDWLQSFGDNTNMWADVWRRLSVDLPDDVTLKLSLNWLNRARVNLSEWPKVFEETYLLLGQEPIPKLRRAAIRWIRGNSRSRQDGALIATVASGETMY